MSNAEQPGIDVLNPASPLSLAAEAAALDGGLGERLARVEKAERERAAARHQRRALVEALSSMSLGEARNRLVG